MKLPKLVNGQMQEISRLHPEEMSLTLNMEPMSQVTFVLGESEPEVAVNDWVEVFTPSESAGYFRIISIDTNRIDRTRSVTAEHGFGMLADEVIFGEVTAADVTGVKGAKKVQVDLLLRHLFSKSSRWVLGRCDYTDEVEATVANTSLLAAVTEIAGTMHNSRWILDQSVTPWQASLVQMDETEAPESELRMARNVAGMSVTKDGTDMFNRIYPCGANGLTIAKVNGGVPYLEEGVTAHGLVCKVYTDTTEENAEELKRKALTMLHEHSTPRVTVSIQAIDLAEATGEPLDKLTIGRVCQVPLPESGELMRERICSLSWPDLMNNPSCVLVTLANKRETFSGSMGTAISKARTESYRSSSRLDKLLKEDKMQIEANLLEIRALDLDVKADRLKIEAMDLDVKANELKIDAVSVQLDALETTIYGQMHCEELLVATTLSCGALSCSSMSSESTGYIAEGLTVGGDITMGGSKVATQSYVTNALSNYSPSSIRASSIYLSGSALYKKSVTIDGKTHYLIAYGAGD